MNIEQLSRQTELFLADKVSLYYKSPEENSDKVYRMWVERMENGDSVLKFAYGRRGSMLKEGVKVQGTEQYVRVTMMRTLGEKLDKGYVEMRIAIERGYLTQEEALLEVL